MRATISVADALSALKPVLGACNAKNTIPVLACVLIEVDAQRVRLTCSDLDMYVSAEIDAENTEAGRILVNAKRFAAMLAGDRATLTLDEGHLEVALKSGRLRLPTIAADDFPMLTVKDTDWRDMPFTVADLASVMAFASREEGRYYLQGACLSSGHLVATTGSFLMAQSFEADDGGIIHTSALKVLTAMPEAKVSVSANWWRAVAGGITATGKLIDGTFPDWPRVVPDVEPTVDVDADDLAEALAWVAKVSSERHSGVKLSVDDGVLTLTCSDRDNGVAERHVPVDGDLPDVAANAAFLITACKAFAGKVVRIGCRGASEPILFAKDDCRVVVMPMRI